MSRRSRADLSPSYRLPDPMDPLEATARVLSSTFHGANQLIQSGVERSHAFLESFPSRLAHPEEFYERVGSLLGRPVDWSDPVIQTGLLMNPSIQGISRSLQNGLDGTPGLPELSHPPSDSLPVISVDVSSGTFPEVSDFEAGMEWLLRQPLEVSPDPYLLTAISSPLLDPRFRAPDPVRVFAVGLDALLEGIQAERVLLNALSLALGAPTPYVLWDPSLVVLDPVFGSFWLSPEGDRIFHLLLRMCSS